MDSNLTPSGATLRKLAERYPFDNYELEILVRCHDRLMTENGESNDENFLFDLAAADSSDIKDRIAWLETNILPCGFTKCIQEAITTGDEFVEYASQDEDQSLEKFIEGVANTGRRGTREALRVLLRLATASGNNNETKTDTVEAAMECVIRLTIADESLTAPHLDKEEKLQRLQALLPLARAVSEGAKLGSGYDTHEQKSFVQWAETSFPLMTSPLSSFVHHILFHDHPYPSNRATLNVPKLEQDSDIFTNTAATVALALMSPDFGGTWRRLYSSNQDGKSFNRLEWSLLGYSGPTFVAVKTTHESILGAYTAVPWKDSPKFYGSPNCLLLEVEPRVCVHPPVGGTDEENQHFMYMHSSHRHAPQNDGARGPFGLGFGGTQAQPRFFIPETFEQCSAGFLDKTFESGELLPDAEREQFEIEHLEVWGLGGDAIIQQALQDRNDHRQRTEVSLERARTVSDRTVLANDFQTGLIPNNKVFAHQKDVRGRHDFRVDPNHAGGYVVEGK